ncbi:T9SS type A sorting domain-containing protein, partial [candidate division WOR-3 bacterium]|nr:T9SS type A sorting domain-containing protein [candidate division WOR-3 bacterium]
EYRAAENKWYELDTIPILGSTGKKKRVKAGGDIVSTGYAFYALKGNKTLEMWRYILPQPGAPGTLPSGQMAAGSERSAAGIFPNPCVDAVRLSLPVFGRASVALFDVTGRNVLTRTLDAGPGSPATIDLRGLCAGVYLVRAEVAGNSFTRRLVIQR